MTTAVAATARPLTGYVTGWVVAGVATLGALAAWADPAATSPSLVLVAVLVVLTAVAEAVSLDLKTGSGGVSLSLLEVAVTVDVLLLPPAHAAAAVVLGVLLVQLVQRRPVQKLLFNLGQHAVAASAVATVVALAPSPPTLHGGRVVAVMLGLVAYSTVNTLALAGIFSRLGIDAVREQLVDRPIFFLATTLGNTSVGVIGVAMWTAYPSLTLVVVGPALALYLSYASSFRIESLLTEVRSERDHLERVVGGVQEGIVLLDETGVVRLWNPAMRRITGVAAEDAVGQPAVDLLTGVDADGMALDPTYALQERRESTSYTATLRLPDDTTVETRLTHTLVTDDRDRVVGDVVVVQDLSREREASSLKEDFVARVSHELRTPLSPLRGYAQIMLRAGDRVTGEQRDQILNQMVERVDHLERLIDDLLLVSRLASGTLSPDDEVDLQVCDLSEIVPRLASWVSGAHAGREVRVHGVDGARFAWADPLRSAQVVTNLLSNACKYATPDTPIDVEVSREEDRLRVAVRDHGPGIPEDKLEAIFERFQRLEDPQRMRTGGLGLGLYIARHLAVAMGGALDVDSRRGAGSTFTLELPVASDAQLLDAAAPAGSRALKAVRRPAAV